MIKANSLAIHLTYTCPLACKHCCFRSSPKVKDRLSVDSIHGIIASLEGRGIELLAFTGGEPFLFGASLVEFVRRGKAVAANVRIVSSAYWAASPEIAARRLEPLSEAGLNELSISWDDYHEEFVAFDNVRNAFHEAKKTGVRPAICMVQSPLSRWTADRVRAELGGAAGPEEIIVESPLNYTGRADEELTGSGVRENNFLGPCPYVMTGPTVSAKGKILACCGVIPETEDLVLGESIEPAAMWASIDAASGSALMTWLHLRGPYSIMRHIGSAHGISVPPPEMVGGNCEACKLLFTTPEIRAHLPAAVAEMGETLGAEAAVLDALGLMNSKGLMGLWEGGLA